MPVSVPGMRLRPASPAANRLRGRCRTSPGGSLLGDPAGLQDNHAVGQHQGVKDVVGDDDGAAPGQDLLQEPAEQRRGMDVQGCHGLVQQQHLGVGRQRPGHRHALGLSAGEFGRPPCFEFSGIHRGQPLPGRLPGGFPRNPGTAGSKGHIFQGAEVREQQRLLREEGRSAVVRCGPGAGAAVEVEQHLSIDFGPAGIGPQESGNDIEQGGFPCPVRAQHRHGFARRKAQPDVESAGCPAVACT